MIVDPRTLGPFYPAQVATGETYVVDGRSGKVVETVDGSFDTIQRWALAKRRADKLNAELWNRKRVTRNRVVLAGLLLAAAGIVAGLVSLIP